MRTIPALFEAAVARASTKTWLTYENDAYTYEQAYDRVAVFVAALNASGVGRGTRVLVTLRNTPDYLFVWLAIAHLGAVCVSGDPRAVPELANLAAQVRPELIVTDGLLHEAVRPASAAARVVLVDDLREADPGAAPPPRARPDDVSVMIPTSGTTGRSKLVMQTHRAYVMAGEGFPFWLGLTGADRLMTSLPLFHINAPAYSVLGSIAAGAGLALLPGFSASRFLDDARRHGATEFNAIGAMVEILMRQPARDDDADNPLRLCYTGPSPTRERQLEIEQRFGLEVVCGYALSETPYGLIWKRGTRPYGTLGSVRQHPTLGDVNRARVVADGRVVGSGEIGELELANPAIMAGYFEMPDETERVLAGGWLRTGDLVRDNGDGTYTFIARRKEVIRRRGENLSPLEVEAALEGHPAVVEAAVVGVPSELSEEEVKAFVVTAPGASVAPAELRDFAAARLAPFKVPRFIEFVPELPHTRTGRIAKHLLPRDRTASEHDLDTGGVRGAAP